MGVLVGFVGTGVDTGKGYIGAAHSNGDTWAIFGPASNRTQQGRSPSPAGSFNAALDVLRNKWRLKIESNKYHLDKVFLCPDVADDIALTEVVNIINAAGAQIGGNLESAIQMAQAFAPPSATNPTTAPARRRIVDTPTTASAPSPLQLDPAEVFVRPNGEEYRPRLVGGIADVVLLRHFRSLARPMFALLVGAAGTGKTAVVEAAFGPELISIGGHGDMTERHPVGQITPPPDGGWQGCPRPPTGGVGEGAPLLIDEINKLPMDLISLIHSATDGRGTIRFEDRADNPVVHAAPGFYVVGTLNPDTLGSSGLPEAITSRFAVQIEVTTDHDAALAMGVPEEFVTVAQNLTTKNHNNEHGREVWVPQMRELLHAKSLIDAGLPQEFAAQALLSQCPWPEDVPVISAVMRRVFGSDILRLATGGQA